MSGTSSPTKWVTLVSEDGYRFVIDDRAAHESPTIKAMIARGDGGGFVEAESNTARLQIRGEVLEKVVEYLYFALKYRGTSEGEIPDFKKRIPPEISIELLMAADFLELV